ncbi:MAG: aminotransferase class V-fold PLP-dependent enzyme, partial [Halomonas sp.]
MPHTVTEPTRVKAPFDVMRLRQDFPILAREVHGKPLIYLDNAATSQTPQSVIDVFSDYYSRYNANIHRGLHTLADEATAAFEGTRHRVKEFLNAEDARQVIFTRGTTEAINLVVQSWGRQHLASGDEVLISMLEHHSNIVPWQLLAAEIGFTIKVIPVEANGALDMAAYRALLSERTQLVAVNHVSNAFGTINPVQEMAALAHQYGALILIDGAQAAPHQVVDVQAIDADFYAFSGHKVYGPTGVGVLYGKQALLEAMPPWQGGGEMIQSVSFDAGTTFAAIPHKFEAGTPAIAEVIALGKALEWVESVGITA